MYQALIAKDNATIYSASADKTAKSWKLASKEPIQILAGHDKMVDAAVFHPDGKILASCSHDGTVRLWDLEKGESIRTINAFTTPLAPVYSLAWSPDGQDLVAGGQAKSLRLFNAEEGKLLQEFQAFDEKDHPQGHKDSIFSVVFTADGKQIVSAGNDGQILVWNRGEGSLARQLVDPTIEGEIEKAHRDRIYQLNFSPRGNLLVSIGGNGWLNLWDFSTGEIVSSRRMPSFPLYSASFSPSGEELLLGNFGREGLLLRVSALSKVSKGSK